MKPNAIKNQRGCNKFKFNTNYSKSLKKKRNYNCYRSFKIPVRITLLLLLKNNIYLIQQLFKNIKQITTAKDVFFIVQNIFLVFLGFSIV